MLSVSDKYLQEINSSSRYMVHRVTINGALLSQGSVTNISFTESISDNNGISVGTANSASLSLTIRDAEPMDYNGLLVKPESGLTLPDGTIEWIPLGEFWVTNFDTSNDFRTLKLTCADGMYNLTGEYESELEYPTTIEAVVNELVAKSGVKFIAPSSYPNVIVRRKPPKMSFRNAFGHAAGCCGKNARFNRNGKLEFVWYNDTGMSIERKMQYLDGMTKLGNKTLVVNFKVKGEVEKYTVNVITDNGGYVAATPSSNVLEGDTVTLSVGANNGYELAILTAKIANGNEVTLTKNGEGGYTFVQPDSDVTVTASFRQNANGSFAISTTTGGNGTIATSKTATKTGETVTTTINPAVYSLRSNMIGTENVEVEYSNPFIYEKAVDAVQSVMQSMAYTPVKLKYRGNPAFQAGDIVTVPDGDGIYHKVLIMSQTMTFGGGMNCTLTCPGQTAQTASFNSDSYISNEISKKLDAATSALENKIGNNNSQALTAIYKSMTSTQKVINEDINQIVDKQTTIEANVNGISTKVSETISDLENLEGRVSSAETSIEQNANDIKLKASNVELNTLGERVSTAESSITQNANNIALKVSKDGVMSAIEQTPETIKIKANRVDIDNLFSQDIYMTGKFESKVTTQVRPTAETLKWINNIISDPNTYNPNGELTSLYDLNCDGVVDSNDVDLMNELRSGDIDFAYLEGTYNYTVLATEVNLEINAHNPNAIVLVWGTDHWGCSFSKRFGTDSLFADSDRIYLGDDLDWLLPKSSVWNTHMTEAHRLEREIVYLKYRFGICSDSASTKIKTVNTYEFDTNNTLTYNLYKGARVAVKFTNSNTASSPQLNVRNSGAKDIRWHGVALPESQYWGAGAVVDFVYNGEQWEIVGVVNTYGTAVTVDDALSSTSTNPVQNKVVKEALDAKLDKKLIINYTEDEIQALWDKVFNS